MVKEDLIMTLLRNAMPSDIYSLWRHSQILSIVKRLEDFLRADFINLVAHEQLSLLQSAMENIPSLYEKSKVAVNLDSFFDVTNYLKKQLRDSSIDQNYLASEIERMNESLLTVYLNSGHEREVVIAIKILTEELEQTYSDVDSIQIDSLLYSHFIHELERMLNVIYYSRR